MRRRQQLAAFSSPAKTAGFGLIVVFEPSSRQTGRIMAESHDDYIARAPETFRVSLTNLRAVLSRTLPDAREVVRYGMPGFAVGDTVVAGYAAFSRQCGLYVDARAITAHADDIATRKLKATKTGVTFSPSRPIPDELVAKLVARSRSENGV